MSVRAILGSLSANLTLADYGRVTRDQGAIRRGVKLSSFLEYGPCKNRSSAQGGVKAIRRHRDNQQNSRQTDPRVPRRALSRQGKALHDIKHYEINDERQQAETDHYKH